MIRYALLVLVFSCATIRQDAKVALSGVPATTVPNATEATELVWRYYGDLDAPPWVSLVTGAALDCGDVNGKPDGFNFPPMGCLWGVTLSPNMCLVAHIGQAWSETSLAHELLHAHQWRRGVADPMHSLPDWQAGGMLEMANTALHNAGM